MDGVGYRWMGGFGASALDEMERREREERMNWLEQEEISRAFGDPFPSYEPIAQPIPRRHRDAARLSSAGRKGKERDPVKEVASGGVPELGEMNEEEYTEWVRTGMYRLQHRAELEERERLRKVKEAEEREKEKAREMVGKEERIRIQRMKAEKGRAEEARRKTERERFRTRWKALEIGGEVEATHLSYADIPWQVYSGGEVGKEGIKGVGAGEGRAAGKGEGGGGEV